MLTSVTSLTGNGLKDWLLQRITAIIFAAYILCIFGFWFTHKNLSYLTWLHFHQLMVMRVFAILALLSFVLHAWIGIWTVTTDYINCRRIRLVVQGLVLIALLSQFIWGCMIVGGI